MRVQVLSSGSEGNATLVRAGEATLLVDAGLPGRDLQERLTLAGVGPRHLDHVLVTHGHLDHSRSAGRIARRHDATLHCAEAYMRHRSFRRAPRLAALRIGRRTRLDGSHGPEELDVLPFLLPHDCDPTVGFRLEHAGRVACIVTDIGQPRPEVAAAMRGAHLLVLEFNWDPELMETGPYSDALRRRITGGRGHLSNEQAGALLGDCAGPELHTLILAHLSQRTNEPARALAVARGTLERLGRADVEVLVADQHAPGPNVKV